MFAARCPLSTTSDRSFFTTTPYTSWLAVLSSTYRATRTGEAYSMTASLTRDVKDCGIQVDSRDGYQYRHTLHDTHG